jgi:RNA ligase (TIGR02306 family)
MSFFAVTIEEIAEIRAHSNADRLAVASLQGIGFQFIVGKDTWKAGDKCLYFPIDSVLTPELCKKLGVEGRLAGAQKNRIKTIKLRGEISQGLIGPLSLIDELSQEERTPEQITEFLEVEKYEPEIELPTSHDARLVDLPDAVGIYDIENCERYPESVKILMETPVWITEKLEGSNFSVARVDGKNWVCQRRFALEPIPDKPKHFFWEVAEQEGLLDLLDRAVEITGATHLVLRGEIIGPNIQSNIYRLQQRTVRFYDAQVDHRYLHAEPMRELFTKLNASERLVPTISYGETLKSWLNGRELRAAATADSALHKTLREGIVIRPLTEQFSEEIGGRLILKQISPEYLAGME